MDGDPLVDESLPESVFPEEVDFGDEHCGEVECQDFGLVGDGLDGW